VDVVCLLVRMLCVTVGEYSWVQASQAGTQPPQRTNWPRSEA